jgi:hypothetical protein
MTFTFNMTVTAKTETMLQDEMQQELLNLIGLTLPPCPQRQRQTVPSKCGNPALSRRPIVVVVQATIQTSAPPI